MMLTQVTYLLIQKILSLSTLSQIYLTKRWLCDGHQNER